MALREAAFSSSGCLVLIGSSRGMIGSSRGLIGSFCDPIGSFCGLINSSSGMIGIRLLGVHHTPMGIKIALIGGPSAMVEGRVWRPAQMLWQATSPASHRQPMPDRIMVARWVATMVTVWWQPNSLRADGLSTCRPS